MRRMRRHGAVARPSSTSVKLLTYQGVENSMLGSKDTGEKHTVTSLLPDCALVVYSSISAYDSMQPLLSLTWQETASLCSNL